MFGQIPASQRKLKLGANTQHSKDGNASGVEGTLFAAHIAEKKLRKLGAPATRRDPHPTQRAEAPHEVFAAGQCRLLRLGNGAGLWGDRLAVVSAFFTASVGAAFLVLTDEASGVPYQAVGQLARATIPPAVLAGWRLGRMVGLETGQRHRLSGCRFVGRFACAAQGPRAQRLLTNAAVLGCVGVRADTSPRPAEAASSLALVAWRALDTYGRYRVCPASMPCLSGASEPHSPRLCKCR